MLECTGLRREFRNYDKCQMYINRQKALKRYPKIEFMSVNDMGLVRVLFVVKVFE